MIPSLAVIGARRQGFGVWLLVILACMVNALSAATFGLFTYTDNGTFITITDYPTSATGVVEIPATINGKPVTSIGNSAFYQCSGLSSVILAGQRGVFQVGDTVSQCTREQQPDISVWCSCRPQLRR